MEEIRHKTAENESLKSKVAELSHRKTMDFIFYTGFPNPAVFDCIYECLNRGSEGDNFIH